MENCEIVPKVGMLMLLDVDDKKIKEIMKSFYILTNIRIAIINNEYREVMAYPEYFTDFCTMIRANKLSCYYCKKSDLQAFEHCKKTGSIYIYKCHAGLTEAAYPLKINDKIIGYIMFGQITDIKNRHRFLESITSKCEKYEIENSKLKKAASKLKYKSKEELISAATFFETSIYYILQKKLISSCDEQIVSNLDRYIENNMKNHLDINTITKELLISRTQLYLLTHRYLGVGIAEYIRNKRLSMAKKLLAETDLSFTEISELTGYCDYNYFRRTFKKREGISLKSYRNKSAAEQS